MTGEDENVIQNWESVIASRMRPCATMPKEEDTSRRAKKISSERYERSAKRKVSRKRWQQSEAGKKSMHDRGERYRHTEKGVKNSRKKAMTYYYAHKNDPDFKAKRAARQRKYRAEAKASKLESKAPPVTDASECLRVSVSSM